jgi:thiol-disulfide isomerase/thioredoxin
MNKAMARLIIMIFPLLMGAQSAFTQPEGGDIRVMNFDQLEPYLHFKNDTVYLVNFWATWCAPCRKEMPAIQAVAEKYKEKPFKVLLVSLDMPGQLDKSLVPFLKTNNIDLEVILLDDPNQNRWIDLVDKSWSGELPFTLIYGKNFRESHSQVFTFEELDSIINAKLLQP